MKYTIDTKDFSSDDIRFIAEMLPYISTHIDKVITDNNEISVELDESHKDDVLSKTEQLKEMILAKKLGGKEIPIKTLADHTDATTINRESVFPELLKTGALHEMAKGVYAYSGIVLKLFRYFNRKIADYGANTFPDLTEHEYPVLYPIQKYSLGRYFETFPHYIMFQTVMNNDLDTLNRFAQNGISDSSIFDEMKKPVNVLRHAACAPLYGILANRTVPPEKPLVYMVKGTCFRNEADNVFELARLNEFTMKEYVFIGTPDQCRSGIEKAKGLWQFWVDTFKLNCKLDTANDSFFASNYKKLKLFQMLGDSKQEFKWYVPFSDNYIACGSINFHRTHFSKPYNIRTDNETYCHTACFAFGIERMIYAFLNQKGTDPAGWDKETFDEISAYVSI